MVCTRQVINMEQKPFKIIFGKERLITTDELALVGQSVKRMALRTRLAALGKPKDFKHKNFEFVMGYLELMGQGKADYEDMRDMLEDPSYYCMALRINSVASPETVRQRLDYLDPGLTGTHLIMEESANLLLTPVAPIKGM